MKRRHNAAHGTPAEDAPVGDDETSIMVGGASFSVHASSIDAYLADLAKHLP